MAAKPRHQPARKAARVAPVQAPAASAHDLAVGAFERGFVALQRRDYAEATRALSAVLDYPEEKELHERARVYLVACQRHAAALDRKAPKTVEERVNGATVAMNRGAFEEALTLLRSVEQEDAENDVAHYMLAVVHSALGDADSAIPHLRRSMELNSENRYLAAQDADLEPLRESAEFAALLESPPSARRRPAPRVRSVR